MEFQSFSFLYLIQNFHWEIYRNIEKKFFLLLMRKNFSRVQIDVYQRKTWEQKLRFLKWKTFKWWVEKFKLEFWSQVCFIVRYDILQTQSFVIFYSCNFCSALWFYTVFNIGFLFRWKKGINIHKNTFWDFQISW